MKGGGRGPTLGKGKANGIRTTLGKENGPNTIGQTTLGKGKGNNP